MNTKSFLLFLFIILSCLISDVKGQNKPLTYRQFNRTIKKMNLPHYTWDISYLIKLYYEENLKYPQTISALIQNENEKIPDLLIRKLFQQYQSSFLIHTTDTSCCIYCGRKQIYEEENFNNLKCWQCSENEIYKYLVRLYDNNNNILNDTILTNLLKNDINLLYKKLMGKKQFVYLFHNIINTNITIPLYVLYQYDEVKGISIHPICSNLYKLEENDYIYALSSLAEEFCKKHNLSKIIFSALLLKENEE